MGGEDCLRIFYSKTCTLSGHKDAFFPWCEAFVVVAVPRVSILQRAKDITTSALPEQVKALFPRTIDTGLKHGTVTIMMDKIGYEVTTYRIDGTYEDHRRPNDVTFTSSFREDLMRRDFTINAMA